MLLVTALMALVFPSLGQTSYNCSVLYGDGTPENFVDPTGEYPMQLTVGYANGDRYPNLIDWMETNYCSDSGCGTTSHGTTNGNTEYSNFLPTDGNPFISVTICYNSHGVTGIDVATITNDSGIMGTCSGSFQVTLYAGGNPMAYFIGASGSWINSLGVCFYLPED